MELTNNKTSVEILVVEDSLTQAIKLQYLLEESGYQVSVAYNGVEALDAIKQHRPTLIISDIVMPEMDGYTLCRHIRADDQIKDIPIILLTALSDLQDVAKALASGADNFVTKPYKPDFLLSRIQHILVNLEIRQNRASEGGIDIFFANQKFFFASEPTQIIDLLLSTFENAVQKNLELQEANQQLLDMQRELKQKNLELEQLNEQKDEFLGIAAHDMRNPLSNMKLVGELLLENAAGKLDEDEVGLLKIGKAASDFMLELVNDLLDITKIESGKLNLKLKPTDLGALVESKVAFNRTLAEKKQIKLLLHHDDADLMMLLDAFKLEQVLNNLLSNAIKFSYPDSKIEIRVARRDNEAIISVKDEGQGIPADELDKLFKPFEKTSVKSTAGERSTGLGLAIVRKIIVGHQGSIWVESEVGKGSTFYVSLPIITEEDAK